MIKYSLLVTVYALLITAQAHADLGDVTIFKARITNGVQTEFTRDLNRNLKATLQNYDGYITLSVHSQSGRKVIAAIIDQKTSSVSGCYQDVVASGFNGPTSIVMYLKSIKSTPECAEIKKKYNATVIVASFDMGDNGAHSALGFTILSERKSPVKTNWDLELYGFLAKVGRIL